MSEWDAVYTIWLREVKKYFRAKERLVGSLVQPLFWFVIFGIGLGNAIQFQGLNVNYFSFVAPGIICMSLLFVSIFSGVSVIWDREFGFLKEILVAPVSRLSIVIGKALGGATTATIQGVIILILSIALGASIPLHSILILLPAMLLISFGFVSTGLLMASLMDTMEGFQLVMNFIVQPMFFLSGALFPLTSLPEWMKIITYIDPMTYSVEVLRYIASGISSFNIMVSLSVLAVFTVAISAAASWAFSRRK
jgi:ABC-2 type transport system permease protein